MDWYSISRGMPPLRQFDRFRIRASSLLDNIRTARAQAMPGKDNHGVHSPNVLTMNWIPNREAALAQLSAFVLDGAAQYAARRNSDPGPQGHHGVSRLSPWLRRRQILETEVCAAVLAQHRYSAVEKYVQEVCWRTYWKGWLQQRPSVWQDYRKELAQQHAQLETESALRRRYRNALAGQTGITCFDDWIAELRDTGYLHNHTRMWFASIWIFTLRLPWVLGAELFLRELLDGDPASNTLSWRWVGGLHTRGKHYLARAENIDRYTGHRYSPKNQLDEDAAPLPAEPEAARVALPDYPEPDWQQPAVLLLHEDDLHAASLVPPRHGLRGVAVMTAAEPGPLGDTRSERVRTYATAALDDARKQAEAALRLPAAVLGPLEAVHWARQRGATRLIVPVAPVGFEADRLMTTQTRAYAQGMAWDWVQRDWDRLLWRHATRGFFQLREKIPQVLQELGLAAV